MKFTCAQDNLAKALQIITRAIPVKTLNELPILANILIKAQDSNVILGATDLETSIQIKIEASVDAEGAITVPSKIFKELITGIQEPIITCETLADSLKVETKKTKAKINGANANDYPVLPQPPKDVQYLEMDSKELAQVVSRIAFSAGNDESRPVFTGIFLKSEGGQLTLAATDGYRLSEETIQLGNKSKDFSLILKARILHEITKIFSDKQTLLMTVLDDQNKVIFQSEDIAIFTGILSGQYPNYKEIIPTDHILKAKFNAQDFQDAVKLTNIFVKEGSKAIKLLFDPEGHIKVSSITEEAGTNESVIPAEVEGKQLEIAFGAKYLLDYLSTIKTKEINFLTTGNVKPCVFKAEEYPNYIHIIMPRQM